MLKAIVNFLNLKLELLNYFDLTRCLCELKTQGDVIAPKEYIVNGEFQNIDFDSSDGVSYWRLRDPITVSREANPNKALKRVQTTVPMKLVFSVRRDKLTTDDAYSFDRIRQTVVKQFNIDNGALTTALGAAKVTITAPSSDGDPLSVWDAETSGTETQEPDFKFVFGSIDIDIVIDSDTECLPTECDDVDSDILHTFDFCDAAVIDRLTAAQVTCLEDALCSAGLPVTEQINGVTIGTVASGGTNNQVIQDSAAAPVGTEANPSVIGDATVTVNGDSLGATGSVVAEGSVDLVVNLDGSHSGVWDGTAWQVTSPPCDDATIELNGVEMTTIPSGDTENISIRQSSGATQVGSKQGTHWRIDDSAISINGSPVADVKAEDSLDIDVTQDGSPVGSWNGSAWIVPPDAGGGTLTIGVYSDAGLTNPITSADFGDTVYINLTTSIATPTEYRFLLFKDSIDGVLTVQAGATLAYVVDSFTDLMIYGESKDATTATASVDVFDLSINADVDANAYIAKHNSLSGLTMAAPQQAVVQTAFQMLKGTGTTNGSNLWTTLLSTNSEIYAFTPVSSSLTDLPSIAIDWVNPATTSTIVGFVLADVANDGVTGSSGKYLILKRKPSDFSQNLVAVHAFSKTSLTGINSVAIGSSTTNLASSSVALNITSNQAFGFANSSSTTTFASSALGLFSQQRVNSANIDTWDNGVIIQNQVRASLTASPNNYYAFANNENGTPARNFSGKLAMVAATYGLTASEMADWNEVWAAFTTNMNN
jgi:hypothetical protein